MPTDDDCHLGSQKIGDRFRERVIDILDAPPEDAPRDKAALMSFAVVEATAWALDALERELHYEIANAPGR